MGAGFDQSQEDPGDWDACSLQDSCPEEIQWTIMSVLEFYKNNTIGNIKIDQKGSREGVQTSGNRESVIFIYEELMGFSIGQ